jgi:hypothetical protein
LYRSFGWGGLEQHDKPKLVSAGTLNRLKSDTGAVLPPAIQDASAGNVPMAAVFRSMI